MPITLVPNVQLVSSTRRGHSLSIETRAFGWISTHPHRLGESALRVCIMVNGIRVCLGYACCGGGFDDRIGGREVSSCLNAVAQLHVEQIWGSGEARSMEGCRDRLVEPPILDCSGIEWNACQKASRESLEYNGGCSCDVPGWHEHD